MTNDECKFDDFNMIDEHDNGNDIKEWWYKSISQVSWKIINDV